MTSTMRAGIIGLVLGFLLGLAGSLVAWVPFWIGLVRLIIGSIAGALILSLAHYLLVRFLPELAQESAEAAPGSGIDVQVDGDVNPYGDDQAADLRMMAAGVSHRSEGGSGSAWSGDGDSMADQGADDVMVEEVQEQGGMDDIEGFNEDAFYSGIDQLPDIGGFSEQFASRGDAVGEAGPGPADFDEPSRPSKGSGGGKAKGGMDPQLMAQAIRTALKKD